ncbi:MAG: bifunctional transaldolase/phosoglucose isomerase [Pseudolabrys sp.]|nr:bifunctional transaldolase/phosoglucose isomerase [Pseudolabrys sp.]
MNPLQALKEHGQSVWLDYLRRSLLTGGELAALIAEDGLAGLTSNPSIFEKAIAGSTDYDEALAGLLREEDRDAGWLYERLAVDDIRMAADLLRPVYIATQGRDGFVSIEVSPHLAAETEATIAEARRLWREIGRENLMIKVPATAAGLPAVRRLVAEGINVNITLLFSRKVYEAVVEAYLAGLEARAADGGDLRRVASVASFFVSRVDTAVDALLEQRLRATDEPVRRAALQDLFGKAAIANAKLAYQHYRQVVGGERWQRLARAGARPQRLLWASTGTKNPRYRDVRYVEELIGPDTVTTLPPATMDAFRHHGRVRASLEEGLAEARAALTALDQLGISLEAVAEKLVADGVQLFADAADKLLGAIERKRLALRAGGFDREEAALPAAGRETFDAALEDWRRGGKVRRLWRRDASLWTGADESRWLGWLDIAEDRLAHLAPLAALAHDVKREGFAHVVLLGMGGSSLAPEVLARTIGAAPDYPHLHVVDSTDPAEIRAVEAAIDLARTLFIVASKSGTTLEPLLFQQYFFARTAERVGRARVGRQFIAITDPGSPLQEQAEREHFREVYHGLPSIGGRYSALSNFGLVPAAAIGIDVARLLETAEAMALACHASVPPADNPGARLGLILGTLAQTGRDKVTVVASPGLAAFGAWLEQLIAESTGKNGRGLIPVDGEPLGPPEAYGEDRVFVYLRLEGGADPQHDAAMKELAAAGQPVVRIAVADVYHLGQEFFRWEMAVAVAGSVLGINPFDQPDVEASKVKTRALMQAFEANGTLPPERPFFEAEGIRLFAAPGQQEALAAAKGGSLAAHLKAHLARLGRGDYAALLAYVARDPAHAASLQRIRRSIRDAKRVATCLGFGPRFLHSTGQIYKGGPNTGVFIHITCDDAADLPLPGRRYGFGVVKAAQARGDFAVLAARGRRVLRVHLGADVAAGLARLESAVAEAVR